MKSLHRFGVVVIVAMFWLGLSSNYTNCEGSTEPAARRVVVDTVFAPLGLRGSGPRAEDPSETPACGAGEIPTRRD